MLPHSTVKTLLFPIVTGFAEALQVVFIPEHTFIAAVWLDMVTDKL